MARDASEAPPPVERLLEPRTPLGRPVGWAEVAMVSDIGDSHELNDDRCLVMTSRDLGERRRVRWATSCCACSRTGRRAARLAEVAIGRARAAGGPASLRRRPSWSLSEQPRSRHPGSAEGRACAPPTRRSSTRPRAAVDDAGGAVSGGRRRGLRRVDRRLGAAGPAADASQAPGDRRLKKLGYEESHVRRQRRYYARSSTRPS